MTTTQLDTSPVPDYAARCRLDGRVVLVLGGGQGMGRQTSHAAASAGAAVVCADLSGPRARSVADEVGGTAWSGDLTKRSEVERLFAETENQVGPVTDIIDIVGNASWSELLDTTDAEWDTQFDLNLRHALYAMQIGGRAMIANGIKGTMGFVASPDGIRSSAVHAAYGAAKAGLISLVKTAAVELAPHGIRVNAIAPDAALTPGHPRSPESIAQYERLIPLGSMQDDTDMAGVLLFLMTDLARKVTGQTLLVDGGLSVVAPLPRSKAFIQAMVGKS